MKWFGEHVHRTYGYRHGPLNHQHMYKWYAHIERHIIQKDKSNCDYRKINVLNIEAKAFKSFKKENDMRERTPQIYMYHIKMLLKLKE